MNYFVSNLVFNHIKEEEEACCFAFIVLYMPCYCKSYVTRFLFLLCVSLQCVIVVLLDHTHLLFNNRTIFLASKLIKQGDQYHKLCKVLSKYITDSQT